MAGIKCRSCGVCGVCGVPPHPPCLLPANAGVSTLEPPAVRDGTVCRPEAEGSHHLVRVVVGMAMEQGIERGGPCILLMTFPNRNS